MLNQKKDLKVAVAANMIHSLDGRYIYQNHPACSEISQQRANLSQLETPLSHYIPPYPHPIPMANSYNILIFLWNSNVPSHCEMIQPISRWIIATRIYIYTSSLIIVFIIIFNYHFILLLFLVIVFLLLLLLLLVFLFFFYFVYWYYSYHYFSYYYYIYWCFGICLYIEP